MCKTVRVAGSAIQACVRGDDWVWIGETDGVNTPKPIGLDVATEPFDDVAQAKLWFDCTWPGVRKEEPSIEDLDRWWPVGDLPVANCPSGQVIPHVIEKAYRVDNGFEEGVLIPTEAYVRARECVLACEGYEHPMEEVMNPRSKAAIEAYVEEYVQGANKCVRGIPSQAVDCHRTDDLPQWALTWVDCWYEACEHYQALARKLCEDLGVKF